MTAADIIFTACAIAYVVWFVRWSRSQWSPRQ